MHLCTICRIARVSSAARFAELDKVRPRKCALGVGKHLSTSLTCDGTCPGKHRPKAHASDTSQCKYSMLYMLGVIDHYL